MTYNPLDMNPSGIVYFGNIGPDQIFESKTDFIFDSGNNYLGINNANPQYTIDASGTGNFIAIRFPDGSVQITAASGTCGGSGTIDGSGNLYQMAIWLDENTISGNNNIIYLPDSGLSGLNLFTDSLVFDSGFNISNLSGNIIAVFGDDSGLFTIKNTSGNDVLNINNSYNVTILDIQNNSGESLFSVNNTNDGIILSLEDGSGNIIFSFATDGTYSGNSVIFGDGTIQTTAYTGGADGGFDFAISVTGNTDTISSGEVIYFTGDGNTLVYYDESTNLITISGSGGDGTLDGSGSLYQLTYWLDSNTLSGDSALVILPGSGLSGLLIQTSQLQFPSGGGLNITTDDGSEIINISDTGTGVIFEVLDSDENVLFSISDENESILEITASSNQSGSVIIVNDSSTGNVAYIDISGNYSGNNIIFGDGTVQTTAYTGQGGSTVDGFDFSVSVTGNADLISSGDILYFTGDGNISLFYNESTNVLTISGSGQDLSSYATISYVDTISGNLQSQISSNNGDISLLQSATGNLDSRVTQNTTSINTVSGLLYNNWNINITGDIDSIVSNDTIIFTGLGNAYIFYDNSTNTISISGSDQDLSSYATISYVNTISGNLQSQITSNDTDISNLQTATGDLDTRVIQNTSDISTVSGLLYNNWNIADGNGNSESVNSNNTVYFSGVGGTEVTYNTTTNIVSISGSASGGGGTIDGGGSINQLTYWVDSNTITGNDVLVYLPNSGLSGSLIQTTEIQFPSGSNLNINTDDGSSILNITDIGTGVIFEVLDADNNELFSISDNNATTLQVTAQSGQSENLLEFFDDTNNYIAYIDISGNYSGNNIIFGDGTIQTTAYTGGAGGTTSPAGSDSQIQYNNAGSFGANQFFTFDDVKYTLRLGESGNIGIGEGVFSGITPSTDNVAIGKYASWDALDTHDRTVLIGAYAGANTSLSTNSDDTVGIGSNALQDAFSGVARATAIGTAAYSGASHMYDSVAIGYGAGQGSHNQNYSVFIGREAGRNTYRATTQTHNIGIGYRSLDGLSDFGDSDGLGNIGIGRESLTGTYGSYNINIGYRGGYDVSGERNTVIGFQAGRYITGRNNIFVGDSAGNLVTGDYNTEIVSDPNNRAIYDGNFSQKLNIENIIHGDSSTKKLQLGTPDGTLSPSATVEIIGSDSANPSVIVRGAASQSDNLQEWQDSSNNVFAKINANGEFSNNQTNNLDSEYFGNFAGRESTGLYNAGFGYYALNNITGDYNVGIGYQAGYNVSGSISLANNVFVGRDAGLNAKDTERSVMIGSRAGRDSSSQQVSVFIGPQAGELAVTPTVTDAYNVGIGRLASYASNAIQQVAIGNEALRNSSGEGPIGIGWFALRDINTTCTYSIGIGFGAGNSCEYTNESVFLGHSAGSASSGANNFYVNFTAGQASTGNNNIEIIGNSTNSIINNGSFNNKLNINSLLLGDTSSKLLAIGNVNSSNLTPDATLEILPATSTDIGLIVQGAVSQTANLQEWQNSAGLSYAYVDPTGGISGTSVTFPDGTTQTTAYTGQTGGGAGTPGGSDSQVQYNNGGSFGGDPKFTWNDTTSTLNVSGAFTATTKSFLIDHPTKSGYKLRYGSLEGPENGVYVRGTSNEEFIYLPDYWSGLVHEDSITINLTPIGKFQQLYIKEKNDIYITVGGVEGFYDYIVYAERKDVDRLLVEE